MCVCVCVCVCAEGSSDRGWSGGRGDRDQPGGKSRGNSQFGFSNSTEDRSGGRGDRDQSGGKSGGFSNSTEDEESITMMVDSSNVGRIIGKLLVIGVKLAWLNKF